MFIIVILLLSKSLVYAWLPPIEKRNLELKELPEYCGIAEYYDDRTFACTMSWDDYTGNHSVPWKLQKWQDMLEMLNSKNLTYTIGIITDYKKWGNNWTLIQKTFEDGNSAGQDASTPYLMEIGSHSISHTHPIYWNNNTAYRQIGTSAS